MTTMIVTATTTWAHRGQPDHALLDEEDAHLAHAGDPPFDVTGAPGPEVGGGKAEQPVGDVVEDVGVEPDGETGQQPALDQSGAHRGQQHPEHPQGQQVQVAGGPRR